MSGRNRFVLRLLLAGVVAGGGYLGWVSTLGTPEAAELLPAGADVVVELRGAGGLARRLSGTRFAAAFAGSETRAWLDRTDIVAALDALRTGIGHVAGFTPGRGLAFDVLGSEAAAAWYPAQLGSAGPLPWVAAGRLSTRAWAAAGAVRLARTLGLGAAFVGSERTAGRTVYSVALGDGQSLHLFFAGRVVLAGSERSLVQSAARAGADATATMRRTPALRSVRDALPAGGELFAWFRDPGGPGAVGPAGDAWDTPAGVVLRAGRTIEIDVAAIAPAGGPGTGAAEEAAAPMPGIALLAGEPLLFLSSREHAPPALRALLAERQRLVAERRSDRRSSVPGAITGRGYAIAVTDTDKGSGLFPAPRGLVMVGMADAATADEALRLVFPPTARTAFVGATRTFATRESFPLAGEFELSGAAVGPHLVFATDTSLIAAVSSRQVQPIAGERVAPEPAWQVTSLASVSMGKALPLLRRWAAPLSGLIGARWPQAPQVASDLELLAAIRTLRAVAGSDGRFRRVAITLDVGDLP